MTQSQNALKEKNFERELDIVANIAYELAGLTISPQRVALLVPRLKNRCIQLSISSLDKYAKFVKSNIGVSERRAFVSILTTNVSSFFREDHHFKFLKEELGEQLQDKLRRGDSVRIWSAGCSTGQEPYSIALTLLQSGVMKEGDDLRILATDIDTDALRTAKRGRYEHKQAQSIPPNVLKESLLTAENSIGDTQYIIRENLQEIVTFKELNLLSRWPMNYKFDVIFCRNVMIYFKSSDQEKLWSKFYSALHPGGTIFVGHSERINDPAFISVGTTTYARIE